LRYPKIRGVKEVPAGFVPQRLEVLLEIDAIISEHRIKETANVFKHYGLGATLID